MGSSDAGDTNEFENRQIDIVRTLRLPFAAEDDPRRPIVPPIALATRQLEGARARGAKHPVGPFAKG